MLTNNKLYMNLNREYLLEFSKNFLKRYLFLDKFYYKILFNFSLIKKFI